MGFRSRIDPAPSRSVGIEAGFRVGVVDNAGGDAPRHTAPMREIVNGTERNTKEKRLHSEGGAVTLFSDGYASAVPSGTGRQ